MEARPQVAPVDSVVGLQPLREAVADCLDQLSAEDRFLLEATHIERITYRELAARMGLHKSYTYRLVKRAELRLRDQCLQHAMVLMYLGLAGSVLPSASTEVILDECITG